ncbi:hypothetical protein ACFOZ0_04695 [Streptomyces yaanensis]|uniref:Uncharacterized protein n=1 Tax=Streptomyces yaanensis TaxID=1142239 RepID=A0ABV7SAY1_9ACTN|nr:hypothetical protein [Streptomyces sp. CGMCC 4.7035]WNC03360.1 hypothetical protein Q2K21_19915 [Streptomyces sp. CGMCC 4.7035]
MGVSAGQSPDCRLQVSKAETDLVGVARHQGKRSASGRTVSGMLTCAYGMGLLRRPSPVLDAGLWDAA